MNRLMCSSHPQNSKIIWGFPQPSLNFLLIHQLPRHQIASWTSYFIWRRPSHQLNWTVWCIDFHNCRIVAQSLNFAINLSFVPWNIFLYEIEMSSKCTRSGHGSNALQTTNLHFELFPINHFPTICWRICQLIFVKVRSLCDHESERL